jgi:predicted Fe-S protein YdhL (DUF1289 family)
MPVKLMPIAAGQVEVPLASPCINVCALDGADICIGCQRSAAEITRWGRMDNAERRQVLARCVERTRANGQFLTPPV